MAIWGWQDNYYIEAGLLQGTKDPHSSLQIIKSQQQDFFLKRYAADLMRNKPVIFLDAVGPKSFFFKHQWQRHENFPAIKNIVDAHYT